jgi:hypothetical protein
VAEIELGALSNKKQSQKRDSGFDHWSSQLRHEWHEELDATYPEYKRVLANKHELAWKHDGVVDYCSWYTVFRSIGISIVCWQKRIRWMRFLNDHYGKLDGNADRFASLLIA